MNERLAAQRAESVRLAVTQLLRQKLGDSIVIESAVSRPDGQNPKSVEIGGYGVGSRDTLRQSGGNRDNNDELYRSVELSIELITTEYRSGGSSVPRTEHPAKTRHWYVTIKKLLVTGIVIPGPAVGWTEIAIMNSLSRKEARYRATLWGGGDPMPSDTPDRDVGRKEASFVTNHPIGFGNFQGTFVRISRLDAQVLVGASGYWISFPNLGKGAFNYLGAQFGLGFPGGYIVAGNLSMMGANPGDTYEDSDSGEETVTNSFDRHHVESLHLTFPTSSANLPSSERTRLQEFTNTWSRRFGAP